MKMTNNNVEEGHMAFMVTEDWDPDDSSNILIYVNTIK